MIGTEFAFYQMKAPVAAIPAIILAVLIYRGELNQGIETFLRGASHPNLILMFMVFMLAGAFASTTSAIGSVDATVQMGLSAIPPAFATLFLIPVPATGGIKSRPLVGSISEGALLRRVLWETSGRLGRRRSRSRG